MSEGFKATSEDHLNEKAGILFAKEARDVVRVVRTVSSRAPEPEPE